MIKTKFRRTEVKRTSTAGGRELGLKARPPARLIRCRASRSTQSHPHHYLMTYSGSSRSRVGEFRGAEGSFRPYLTGANEVLMVLKSRYGW